jgi:hypothetical protein
MVKHDRLRFLAAPILVENAGAILGGDRRHELPQAGECGQILEA